MYSLKSVASNNSLIRVFSFYYFTGNYPSENYFSWENLKKWFLDTLGESFQAKKKPVSPGPLRFIVTPKPKI